MTRLVRFVPGCSRLALLPVGLLMLTPMLGQGEVRIWEEDVVLPTYQVDPPDLNPMFYRNESYQGAQKRIYPYPFQEHVTDRRKDQSYRFVFIENEFIRLSVVPELGGRLFSALDKTDNYEIFYRQHVIKPALIGMLGAWISGGIEWCVFHHHRNTTFMPVDHLLAEGPDGSKTVWFGETERRHRMRWVIGVTLRPGRSFIEVTVKTFNRRPMAHSMLYWANVAVHSNDDYQVFFPPSVDTATFHAKNQFIEWPVGSGTYQGIDYRGVDLSWWKNHPEPVSFFAWNLQEDFMGGYDHGKEAGVVHVGNHHILAGAKLWEWGPGPRGRMWDKILTDTDGPYAELMVGAYSDNQPDYSWTAPSETRHFKQYWFPLRKIGGVRNANLDAAVNLEVLGSKARFGVNASRSFSDARVLLMAGSRNLFDQVQDIGPDKPFVSELALPDGVSESDIKLEVRDRTGRQIIAYQPELRKDSAPLPDRVQPPPPPNEIRTVEELYLTGLRLRQIYNPTVDASAYFEEALNRDPGDTRTNTIVGIDLAQRGLYQEAREHLQRALSRLSAEYTRPRDMEAAYYLGWVERQLGHLDEAYRLFYRATWDSAFHAAAYQQLAELSSSQGDYTVALEHIDRSLETNAVSPRAWATRSAMLRKLGRIEEAREAAEKALQHDPLDFFSRNEGLLALDSSRRPEGLQKLGVLMRNEAESYLEVASDYMSLGLWDDAIAILGRADASRAPVLSTYPILHYYLGYCHLREGDAERAKQYFRKAASMPPDYVFPYRLETIPVLETAIQMNPSDARAHHYLGNLLYEIQPDRAVQAWEASRKLDATCAPVDRNLAWAYYYHLGDVGQAIRALETAISNDHSEPRYFSELDRLYEEDNRSPEQRVAMLEKYDDVVKSRNGSLLRQIAAQISAGSFEKAVESLENTQFHVREGGEDIHDLFVDAHLLRGLGLLRRGDAAAALKDFLRAAEYPENLSVGVPRVDPRSAQVAYFTALAYRTLGDRNSEQNLLNRAASASVRPRGWEARYYQARALQDLGRGAEAAAISRDLLKNAEEQLQSGREIDFFAKFGERESEAAWEARAHHMKALALLGLGDKVNATEALERSLQLNGSNAWVRYQLEAVRP